MLDRCCEYCKYIERMPIYNCLDDIYYKLKYE